MISATTTDSKSVTIEYNVTHTTDASDPVQFGVYRSSDGRFDSNDALVATYTLTAPGTSSVATLDEANHVATSPGNHQLTIPLPEGLAPFPEKPYVLVVFPASAPVNLDFIGHSEGTVINAYAIVTLKDMMTPGLQAGYIKDTMLDPHAANNNLPGQQLSIAGGVLAPLARSIITNYQGKAQDPPVVVPSIVDQAQVFFEHTPAKGGALYNLWGQVPVKSYGPVVHYYNLTPSKATHTGKTGVQFWYRNFIVPSLGNQAPLVKELQLNGQIDHAQVVSSVSTNLESAPNQATAAREDRIYGPQQLVETSQPGFSGTAAPRAVVKLSVSPMTKPWEHVTVGTTQANATGAWSLTTAHALNDGQYRVIVSAFSRALRTRPGLTVVSMQPLGRLVVNTA
jgi:hypothetical protein